MEIKLTKKELGNINYALYCAIEWNKSLLDSYNIEDYMDKDNIVKSKIPDSFKKEVKIILKEIKDWKKIKTKIKEYKEI